MSDKHINQPPDLQDLRDALGRQAGHNQQRASDPSTSAWVMANAGTGKTKVLSDRVLRILLGGTDPSKILCLTFTRAAAAEMSNRIAERLAGWATVPEDSKLVADLTDLGVPWPQKDKAEQTALLKRARQLFARLLDTPGGMRIMTIHSFCQSLLKRFPLEAGVSPHFELIDERDAALLLEEAWQHVLGKARTEQNGLIAQAFDLLTARLDESQFTELVQRLINGRRQLNNAIRAHGGLAGLIRAVYQAVGADFDKEPEDVLAAQCTDAACNAADLRQACAVLLEKGGKTDKARAKIITDWLAMEPGERAQNFSTYLGAFFTSNGLKKGKAEPFANVAVKLVQEQSPETVTTLENEIERLTRVYQTYKAYVVAEHTQSLLLLGGGVLSHYEVLKKDHARMDYDDLIEKTGQLLNETGSAAWVLYKLDAGIDHILVDEAQDTNASQWSIVQALTNEFFAGKGAHDTPRTIFAVGDRKQSIFSFQGADPDAFETMRSNYSRTVPEAGAKWDDVALNVSFRSTNDVLGVVNAVLQDDVARTGVLLADESGEHVAYRAGDAGRVELWPALETKKADSVEPWTPPVERIVGDKAQSRLARLISEHIGRMVHGRELLPAKGRAVTAGDIMILVRRRNAFVDELVRELKHRNINVAGVDRMIITEQISVMDLMALGHVLLLPEDDLTLATVLKSPLVGLSEEELFTLAYGRNKKSLWSILARHSGENSTFGVAFDYLAGLQAKADYLTPFALYSHILGPLGGRKKLVARLGVEALDPLDEFINLALSYEQRHAPSLQGFLHWMQSDEVTIKRDLDQGSPDSVRIMTVHGSKGLQAPIVFLPDTVGKPQAKFPLLWDDQKNVVLWAPKKADYCDRCHIVAEQMEQAAAEEYRRLLYVGMTRAEDRLYICGWETTKKPKEGSNNWYEMADRALAPVLEKAQEPLLETQAGLKKPEILQTHSIQGWQVEQKAADTGRDYKTALPGWVKMPAPEEPLPPRPLAPSKPDDEEPAAASPYKRTDPKRFLRGRIIHRLLQFLPDYDVAQRAKMAADYVAIAAKDMPVKWRKTLVTETLAVLNHADFAPVFGPDSLAEVPVAGQLGKHVISGQVDRLVVTESHIIVVDFKTNRPPPENSQDVAPLYLKQMAAYRAALQKIYPAKEVRTALLWTDGPRLMVLDNALLAQYAPTI